MNIMNTVAMTTMKKNAVRTLVTTIGIILAATMFTAVTTFCSSMYSYMRDSAVYRLGSYHISAQSLPGDVLSGILNDKRLASASIARVIGYAEIDSVNEYKPYLFIEGINGTFPEEMPVHLTDGRLPENGSELLIPAHLYSNGGVSTETGSTLTLDVGKRLGDGSELTQLNPFDPDAGEEITDTVTKTYTVVGHYERPRFETYTAPGYTALTYDEDGIAPDAVYDGYFTLNNVRRNIEAFTKENGLNAYRPQVNQTIVMFEGYTLYDNWTNVLYMIAAIFCILIFIGSVSLIYSAFSISVNERTKQFGLLSSIGATKKQIRRSVLTEAFTLSLIGIPIGLAVGIAGMGITLYFCRGLFASLADAPGIVIHLKLSLPAIITAVAITLLTVLVSVWIPSGRAMRVTPIEAIRQAKETRVGRRSERRGAGYSKLFYRLFGAEGVLAKKYYARSRRRYRATIISLAMSVLMFVSASSFCMYLMKLVGASANTSNYDIAMQLSVEDFERLRLSPGGSIESLSFITEAEKKYLYTPDSMLTEQYLEFMGEGDVPGIGIRPLTEIDVFFVDGAAYAELLESNGIDWDAPVLYYNHAAISVRHDDGKLVKYEYDILKSGTDTVLLSKNRPEPPEGMAYYDMFISENGEPAIYYAPINTEFDIDECGRPIGFPTAPVEFEEIELGAYIDELPIGLGRNGTPKLIFPLSEGGRYDGGTIYLRSSGSKTDAAINELRAALDDSGISYSPDGIYDLTENEAVMRNIVTLIRVFSYGFIVLISLISIANVFNTISTNVAMRRRDYAMLRSIGMAHRGMNRMMSFECILYGTRSLLIGLPLAVAFTYLIFLTVKGVMYLAFTLPWTAVGIAVLCVFIVVFVSMLYAVGRIKKDNPIDALKNENV